MACTKMREFNYLPKIASKSCFKQRNAAILPLNPSNIVNRM